MPTAQASLRALSPWRNGALSPYPASANTQPKRTPAAMTRSISARAISGFVRAVRYSAGTPRALQPSALARPTLGKKQPQRQHDRYFALRKRYRHQRLAIGGLAERRSILRSDTYRMRTLLGNRGVVDHQHGIAAADEPIRLNK